MYFHRFAILETHKVRAFSIHLSACSRDGWCAGSQLQSAVVRADELQLRRHLICGDDPVGNDDLDIRKGREPALKILADRILALKWLRTGHVVPHNIIWKDSQRPFDIMRVPSSDFFF